jgi:hypothetical protein
LADAGAKLNVHNRLGICPVDAAKGDAVNWLQERGFSQDPAMVQLMQQQEAMEKETLSTGTRNSDFAASCAYICFVWPRAKSFIFQALFYLLLICRSSRTILRGNLRAQHKSVQAHVQSWKR